jgi:hypothetical protein
MGITHLEDLFHSIFSFIGVIGRHQASWPGAGPASAFAKATADKPPSPGRPFKEQARGRLTYATIPRFDGTTRTIVQYFFRPDFRRPIAPGRLGGTGAPAGRAENADWMRPQKNTKERERAQCSRPQPKRRGWMERGKAGGVKGIIVRGIKLQILLPIPLTNIPLTLAFSGKTAGENSVGNG